ncbi:hypothetical protein H4582DRAFT_1934022 [Lactarius indigo]|nr:hypothetical protein H4582DRAFT_1934022 [Lactarius indigo]
MMEAKAEVRKRRRNQERDALLMRKFNETASTLGEVRQRPLPLSFYCSTPYSEYFFLTLPGWAPAIRAVGILNTTTIILARHTMPKRLRLKRTPAEQAEHDFAQGAARDTDLDSASKHPGGLDADATAEDERFQQKLWDALDDDNDRLDGIEARLNEYAHVPRRWRGVGSREYNLDSMGGVDDDPRFMNDDEYAEWVRVGIWWEQHRKAAQAAARAEAARILEAEEDARRRRHEERERKRQVDARDTYDRRWVELLNSKSVDLGFGDVPWPVRGKVETAQLTAEAISAFLFPSGSDVGRTRKEALREAMLRFHPDKFEGRVIPRIRSKDRDSVREGANAVARAVMILMEINGAKFP